MGDVENGVVYTFKALDAVTSLSNEIDNQLVLNSGNLSDAEKYELEGQIKTYQKYKVDVLFSIHNFLKIQKAYTKALGYAQEHTRVNEEIYKKESRNYAYALMLEAQCMTYLPNLDQNDSLKIINSALKIMLQLY